MNPVVKLIWTSLSRGQECDCGRTVNRNRSATASERLLHFGKVVIILVSLDDHKGNKSFLIKLLLFMD